MPSLATTIRASVLGAMLLGATAPVRAQEGGGHPLDSALETMDLKTQAGPMPDFVTQSRGARPGGDYIPVGAKPPVRSLKPKSAADVKALTAELDAAGAAQRAGKRPKPMSGGAPSAGKRPGKSVATSPEAKRGAAEATNN